MLKERVSIRNLVTIFESLADNATMSKDINVLTEYVRQSLSRQITEQYLDANKSIKVISLSSSLEKK